MVERKWIRYTTTCDASKSLKNRFSGNEFEIVDAKELLESGI